MIPLVSTVDRSLDTLSARMGAGLLLLMVVATLLSFTTLFDAGLALDLDARLMAPSLAHLLGTDQLGRDVFALIAAGARTSLLVAAAAVAIGAALGVPLGLWAAARGGVVDEIVARTNDLLFAFPSLLLAVLLAASMGPGVANAIIAIGLFNIPVFARVARGSALPLLQRDFVLAARVAGKGQLRIALEHVLPNLIGLLIVQVTIQLALGVAAEAGLSYVGIGAQPPLASWGRMLNEAQTLIGIAPWLAWFPGLAIAFTVLGFSFVGEALARRLDPRRQARS